MKELEAIKGFSFEGEFQKAEPWGNGHINDTFRLVYQTESGEEKCYVLQRLNTDVFTRPIEVMENICNVTTYLREILVREGGDPDRGTLNTISGADGAPYYIDSKQNFWRAYQYIPETICLEQIENKEDFYEIGLAFGDFQKKLANYPIDTLHETIVGFHDTKARFAVFQEAVRRDVMGRAASVKEEIAFVMNREALACELADMAARGEMPLRVTHNDTKINNIMLDKETRKAVCVIDLDTVMPGLAVNDFGDAIRAGANTAAEDETDLEKVSCSMELFEVYAKGFIEGCGGRLTEREIEMLPVGAKTMTFECGMRFLTDYLQGDTYFKIHREHQNLDRCRTQFKLVADMEHKWDEMKAIVMKYNNK